MQRSKKTRCSEINITHLDITLSQQNEYNSETYGEVCRHQPLFEADAMLTGSIKTKTQNAKLNLEQGV